MVYFSILRFNLTKPTGYVMHPQFNIQQLYALPTLFLVCFVFIYEQTATCATYSINWLVFVTEMKSFYSAVRTGPINKTVCLPSLKGCLSNINTKHISLLHVEVHRFKKEKPPLVRRKPTYTVFSPFVIFCYYMSPGCQFMIIRYILAKLGV